MLQYAQSISTIAPFAELQEKTGKLDTFEQVDFSWGLEYRKISTGVFLIKDEKFIIDEYFSHPPAFRLIQLI